MPVAYNELVSEKEWGLLKETAGLSPRQADIVKHIIRGKSDRQIASELNITVPTVRTHIDRLFRKFDLNDRLELLVYIFVLVRNGWAREDMNPSAEARSHRVFSGVDMEHHERTAGQRLGAEQAHDLQH